MDGALISMFRCVAGLLAWMLLAAVTPAAESIRAELGQEVAWVGEAVPLRVTLYAPGPFSGTASFELPELPRTVILKTGNPVVGSEVVDGETLFTQLHEFTLFTEQEGTLEVPPFTVRFEAKSDFTSPPQPRSGQTSSLELSLKPLPESQEGAAALVTATSLSITQTWLPPDGDSLRVGELVERRITQRAEGTTAMLLTPARATAPEGVRVYTADPTVQDQVERGQARATRSDTLRYAFEEPGRVSLPELSYAWFDPEREIIQRITLPARTWVISGEVPQDEEVPPPTERGGSLAFAILSGLGVVVLSYFVLRGISRRRASTPLVVERRAAAAVRQAAGSQEAHKTYQAILRWQQAIHALRPEWDGRTGMVSSAWQTQWDALSGSLFGRPNTAWSGTALVKEFDRLRDKLLATSAETSPRPSLTPLNPRLASVATHLTSQE